MILFCVDQLAGAEYLLPLFKRWRKQQRQGWNVYAGPRSASILQSNRIPVAILSGNIADTACALIDNLRPSLILLSSSIDSEIEAVFRRLSRESGIKCAQFIDMWVNYEVRFRDLTGKPDYPDFFLTLDNSAKQAMVGEGLPNERIVVIGQPYFEARLQELASRAKRGDLVRGQTTLLVTQPVSKYLGRRLGYDEVDFLDGILQAWKLIGADWTRLHVIVHPDENRNDYDRRLAPYSSAIQLIENNGLDLSTYSLVIGMYSSLMIHAMLANVNTVSFQPGAIGSDACHLSAQGLVKRMTTVEELARFLAKMNHSDLNTTNPRSAALVAAMMGSCDRLEHFLLA